jgi:hypothetical protein
MTQARDQDLSLQTYMTSYTNTLFIMCVICKTRLRLWNSFGIFPKNIMEHTINKCLPLLASIIYQTSNVTCVNQITIPNRSNNFVHHSSVSGTLDRFTSEPGGAISHVHVPCPTHLPRLQGLVACHSAVAHFILVRQPPLW